MVIKIDSFTPVDNFTRRSWEFYDDQMVVKTKSLTFEYENEVKYVKIKSIQSKRRTDLKWIWASFVTVGLMGLITSGLIRLGIAIPNLDVIEKIVVICALVMLFPAFRRYEYYSFLDGDKNFLTTVRVNQKNKQSVLEAIKLIKQRAEITSETYFDDSLPGTSPVFQFTVFDFADFLNRSKVNVYDDKIIDVEKSLVEEVTTVIRYAELSGKTKIAKMGNDNWDYVWSYWLILVCITGISAATFFAEQLRGNYLLLKLFFGGLALLIPLFLFRYIKGEILIFYDKQDYGVFWTWVNASNREKLKQIVEFVKGKVESQK
jgi:hypothetical protein